ncbi:hypothetical protein C7441_112181 [Pseudaminobacter salicylatoxidans]|uniref:Uncharacterized protein n=1 Tax=Pseudaminobacter salicylatoxidans TaxID=93369 RepID=A0A316CLG7_PSESE|nr:hypothetical protein [Pseudaminobacter salicylatoxidans]PWJ80639.1 hypothetical protein C7441_112181 [Pseudaminobacter salicylatoxidans]
MASKFNYAKSQATAERLLKKFGRSLLISREFSEADPAKPWEPGVAYTATYLAFAAVLPASKGTIEAFDNRLEGGTLIDERLRYVLMSPVMTRTSTLGPDIIEPQSLDVLTFDGREWTVLGCTPLNPAGPAVLYPMGVKR